MAKTLSRCGNILPLKLKKKSKQTKDPRTTTITHTKRNPKPKKPHHPNKHNNKQTTHNQSNHTTTQCRYKTDEEVPGLRVFSNPVACSFSKKLDFEPPTRPHWRTVNLSFLGLMGLCLAPWRVCGMAPASSFPLHNAVWHLPKAPFSPPKKKPGISKGRVTTLQLDASLPILT